MPAWTSSTFPDDPRPPRWHAPGAGARQLRRPASRPHQDHRARAAARAGERGGDGRRDDVRSASAARRPARQGAAAAHDEGAAARGDWRARASTAWPSCGSRPSCRSGIPRRSCARCSSSGCTSAEVWVGANFLFGRDRAGNFSLLRTLGARYGFRAEKIDPVRYKEFVVSSTRIRRLISEGRVDEAGALLGHPYVDRRHGGAKARGADAQIGFPTANLADRQRAGPAERRLRHDRAAGRR